MEQLFKLYTTVARRRPGGSDQGREDASSEHHSITDATPAELQQRPRQPETAHLARNHFLGNASSDIVTLKPRKSSTPGGLAKAFGRSSPPTSANTAAETGKKSELLDHFLALPPELQLMVLSYLDFSDIERLRRTCRFFRARVSPPLVRALLAPDFMHHVRHTCRKCLRENEDARTLVNTSLPDRLYPFSSRCVDCLWDEKAFKVGKKYLLGNMTAVFICRWCGHPVASQPAWNQPEFHKRCFQRYTRTVFLYYQMGVAQWVVVFIASALCWHYFRSRLMWVVGVVVAGFIVTLWNFCVNALRGTIIRTYHISLLLEALIFASWLAPLLELFRINSQQMPPRAMNAYEKATVVFIIFNLVSRGVNIIGNAILACEYKLWRHKKPHMSAARSAWIHAVEVFLFYVEPQCVEQEYPPKWWFSRRRPTPELDLIRQGIAAAVVANQPANNPAPPPGWV